MEAGANAPSALLLLCSFHWQVPTIKNHEWVHAVALQQCELAEEQPDVPVFGHTRDITNCLQRLYRCCNSSIVPVRGLAPAQLGAARDGHLVQPAVSIDCNCLSCI